MSYLKCCCVLMWYYVFAIKIKYYGRKKARHIAIHLRCYYDYSVFPSIHIVFSKKPHFTTLYTVIKKETCTVFFVEPIWLVDFSFLHKIILKIIYT